jgi:hypothetical protein
MLLRGLGFQETGCTLQSAFSFLSILAAAASKIQQKNLCLFSLNTEIQTLVYLYRIDFKQIPAFKTAIFDI